MAFASVQNVATQGFASNATSFAVDIPAGWSINSGDYLLVILSWNEITPTLSSGPSDYTQLASDDNLGGAGVNEGYLYHKVADGTEAGTTATFSLSATSEGAAAIVLHVRSWGGTLSTDVDISTTAEATGSTPNPGSVTAGWGSDDNLFVAILTAGDDDATVTGWPTNYSSNQTSVISGAGTNQGATVAIATRDLAASSDDPAAFTLSQSEGWGAWTVVIKPGSSGDGGGGGVSSTLTLLGVG